MTERCEPVQEINAGGLVRTMMFSANGKFLLGIQEGVRLWRVEDGQEVAMMEANGLFCAAVSWNASKIAAGTRQGDLLVWNADSTHEQIFRQNEGDSLIRGVDFSPDSMRVVAGSNNWTASVWDIAMCQRVLHLRHDSQVITVQYAPEGNRIATATYSSIRVYDGDDGNLLLDTATVAPSFNQSLHWSNSDLFLVCNNKIKQLGTSTGSQVSEWPAHASISLSKRGCFIGYPARRTVTLWNVLSHTKLSHIQHPQDIRSIALSEDDRFLAICGKDGKIFIKVLSYTNTDLSKLSSLPRIIDSALSLPLERSLPEPDPQVDDGCLELWKQDKLENADALLSKAISGSLRTSYDVLTTRALVRNRLCEWNTALLDAEKAIEIQPSIVSYVAKSIALVGQGEKHKGYRVCDIAFARSHSPYVNFLLIKAIVVFMAGEYLDAISRIDDLIAMSTSNSDSVCYVVQAYMYLLLGNMRMERSDYEGAIESFEHGRAQVRHHAGQLLLAITLIFGWKFDDMELIIQQRLGEALFAAGHINDAVELFKEMTSQFVVVMPWALDFQQRCCEKLTYLGDSAMNVQRHDEAISHYSTALSLDPPSSEDILIKRGNAFLEMGSWNKTLNDVNQAITLDPSSPWGYKIKHAALHNMGAYTEAIDAFQTMLSKMAQSPDLEVQQCGDKYISPSTTRTTIHKIVQRTIRHSPRVLINTLTGRLHNRTEQASTFESLPIFNELVSSMTTHVDYSRIKSEVRNYFQYVMLSHTWEENEPLFEHVVHKAVYDLDISPTHEKLRRFCEIVRDAGFLWAWSDTCCINKSNHFVLQEALVAMFKWYQNSALVLVFLRGVFSWSQLGALVESIWNTRGWTLQEYVAAKVIHFYTEEWTPYLNLTLTNHKESPEVISEMELATGVSAEQLRSLCPGLTSIREKLRLASTRHTTLVEDAAYSLLGIFSVTGMSAIYGEGEGSLGRLLAHVISCSGDVSILAWTGESGSFNSCLPAQITVFNGPSTSHLPSSIPDSGMEEIPFNLDVALNLYNRLNELPAPWFAASRMKLPCIAFALPAFKAYRTRTGRIYRTDTPAFGAVRIKTRYDLARMESLYLVHPWLDRLLGREAKNGGIVRDDVISPSSPDLDDDPEEFLDEELGDDEEILDEGSDDSASSCCEDGAPSRHQAQASALDKETRARRLVRRLRWPFGGLLLTMASTGGRTVDYRRVAADGAVVVQFQAGVSLEAILDNVRTLDVL